MNVIQFAKLIGVHHNTAYQMVKDGRLKAVKKNGVWRIEDSEVINHVSKQAEMIEKESQKFEQLKQVLGSGE